MLRFRRKTKYPERKTGGWVHPVSYAVGLKDTLHSFQGLHSKSKFPKHCFYLVWYHNNLNDQPRGEGLWEAANCYPNQQFACSGNKLLSQSLLQQNGHCPSVLMCGTLMIECSQFLLQTVSCLHGFSNGWTGMQASTQPVILIQTLATNVHVLDPTKNIFGAFS